MDGAVSRRHISIATDLRWRVMGDVVEVRNGCQRLIKRHSKVLTKE